MNALQVPDVLVGFVTLLFLPTLGVLGLVRQRRAIPMLAWSLGLWTVAGGIALATGNTLGWSQERFLRVWGFGFAIGAGFLGVAWLRKNPRVKPWLKVGLALLTLAAFGRALLEFWERYG